MRSSGKRVEEKVAAMALSEEKVGSLKIFLHSGCGSGIWWLEWVSEEKMPHKSISEDNS